MSNRHGEFPQPQHPQDSAYDREIGSQEPDQGRQGHRMNRKLVAGGLVMAVAAGAGAVVANRFLGFMDGILPEQITSPEDSHVESKTITIQPVAFDCRSLTVFDHAGSEARTKYSISDIEMDFTGYGAVMTKGKSVLEACSIAPDIDILDISVDGQPGKEVRIPLSSLRFDAQFNEADTEVVRTDPALSQFGGALIDGSSALAEAACNIVSFGQAQEQCEAANVVSNWNSTNQAELNNSLRARVLEETQRECAPYEWSNQTMAMTDSYRQQAVDQGFSPESIQVVFVDDAGQPTNKIPDFTRSTLDELYDQGVLARESDGPDITFSGVNCTPLEGGYQPKYPDSNTQTP